MADRGDFVTIVSGLPRSGTSMMMRMLEAGGLPVLTDHVRTANADNPRGYYEFEPVKALDTDKAWVGGARGMAVKVIYKRVYDLPPGTAYRILFMQRDLGEVLRSQAAMMRRDGLDPDEIGQDRLAALFQADILTFRRWAEAQANIDILYVDHARAMAAPLAMAREVSGFLGGGLDTEAMAGAVEPALWRNRA